MSTVSFLIFTILISFTAAELKPAAVLYEWNYANFTWPSVEAYENTVKSNEYILENNPIAGIKIWKGRLYLTTPRWKDGVPATLLVTSLKPVDGNLTPLLEPYPSWEMQRVGNCSAFQYVQSMEIDPLGRMWVIDTGRVSIFQDNPRNYCPPRLVILDLENDGEILLNYVFPADVARRDSAYLNDIDLEHEDGGYAYITDTDPKYPGIIVFSLRDKTSWKLSHSSMKATTPNFTVEYDGTRVTRSINVNGVALSQASLEGRRTLYYCPLSSLEVFAVPTRALKRDPSSAARHIRRLGRKSSQSGGMIVSADGRLYYTLLAENAVGLWDTRRPPFQANQRRVFKDNRSMQWSDTFAIDEAGALWLVTNRLHRFLAGTIRANETNFRVIRLANLGSKSYQYYEDGSAPLLPPIGRD